MIPAETDLIKVREIHFHALGINARPAHDAALALTSLPGLNRVSVVSPLCLQAHYRLPELTLAMVEGVLVELGFHLENSLLVKLKRAFYHYVEETQLANLGVEHHQSTRDVFVRSYLQRFHGCRDHRPEHIRRYS